MTPVLVSLVFVFVVGFPPAVALSRSWTLAVPLSAPVSLVVCGCSAFVSAVFGLPFLPTLAACSLFATAWSAWSVWRVAPSGQASSVLQADGALAGFISAVLGLVILCYRSAPPGAWDANVIWWFHASSFEAGGVVARSAMKNPLFLYSQPDYPPGDPAVIAGIWRLTGSRDLHYAQAATSILTALTVATLLVQLSRRWVRHLAVVLVAGLLTVAALHLGNGFASHGYVDLLAASLLTAAFVTLYDDSQFHRSSPVGVLLLAAATLTKGEGLLFGAAGLLAIAILGPPRRRVRFLLRSAVGLVPGLLWAGFARMMNPNVGRSVEVVGFVRLALLRPRERHRFGYAFPKVLASISWYAIGAFVITLALLALTRRRPRSLGLCLFLPALGVIMTLLVVCVYAVGPFEVSWWLATSLSRVVSLPSLLFLMTPAVALLDAHVPRGHTDARTAREGQADSPLEDVPA